MRSAKCVWCGHEHAGALVLCEACEQLASAYRRANGLALRKIAKPGEEPDD